MPAWLNLPNLFTLSRLVLTPFVIAAILDGRHGTGAGPVRDRGMHRFSGRLRGPASEITTQAGEILDPIADKCLLSGVFLALARGTNRAGWAVWNHFRAGSVDSGRKRDCPVVSQPCAGFPPSVWGKWSTFVQILTAVSWMARNAVPETGPGRLCYANALAVRGVNYL